MLVEDKNIALLERVSKQLIEDFKKLDKEQIDRVYAVGQFLASKLFGPADEMANEVPDEVEADTNEEE